LIPDYAAKVAVMGIDKLLNSELTKKKLSSTAGLPEIPAGDLPNRRA